ncbi:hypothetical protein N8700_00515 [Candidatus Pelagibacter sp.]|nr:hypothetical protein [Candidatus Pelagibacter sp.]|tara:strand:+ start:4820 stop:5083 length:264 start_codon:yes stop_codon:yes gene_type:complete
MKIKFELLTNLSKDKLSQKKKILISVSIGWIIFIGYLTWLNGINDLALIKTFRWDEWFWFGIIPATIPYLYYYIWKPRVDQDEDKQE